jgi:hypothetical protein
MILLKKTTLLIISILIASILYFFPFFVENPKQETVHSQVSSSTVLRQSSPVEKSTLPVDTNGKSIDLGGSNVVDFLRGIESSVLKDNPGTAYQAYRSLSVCSQANDAQRALRVHENGMDASLKQSLKSTIESARTLCAGVGETQLKERLTYLRVAAKGGIADAQVTFFIEGPTGEPFDFLASEKDDQRLTEWKTEALGYLEESAKKGFLPSISILVQTYSGGVVVSENSAIALKYAIAESMIRGVDPSKQSTVNLLSKKLTPDQVDSALDDAKQLVAQCCAKRSEGGQK